jgi:Septum formation
MLGNVVRTRYAMLVILTVLLGACDPGIAGNAVPGADNPSRSPAQESGAGGATLPSDVPDGQRPVPGQCFDTARATLVDCVRPHDAEVLSVRQLPGGLPSTRPSDEVMNTVAMPACRAGMAEYLGSGDADATNIVAWAFWPDDAGWAKGERWLLCALAEVGTNDRPTRRTGSLRGALTGSGVYQFQICSLGSPTRDDQIQKTACDTPHLGEALPGVINVGTSADPIPEPNTLNAIGQQQCGQRLADYLGAPANPQVRAAWRIPNPESWARGYTTIVCYAEPTQPVSVRLRGLGTAPLPV